MAETITKQQLLKKLELNDLQELSAESNLDKFSQYLMIITQIDEKLHQEIAFSVSNYRRLVTTTFLKLIENDMLRYPDEMKVYDLLMNILNTLKKQLNTQNISDDDCHDIFEKSKIITSMIGEIRKENDKTSQYKWMVTVGGFSLLATFLAILFRHFRRKSK